MKHNYENDRPVLKGPVKKPNSNKNDDATEHLNQKTKHNRVRHAKKITSRDQQTSTWLKVLSCVSLVLPLVSMLFPLSVAVVVSGLGAILGLMLLLMSKLCSERRWVSISGMVIGTLLIAIYLILIRRGVYSIVVPTVV